MRVRLSRWFRSSGVGPMLAVLIGVCAASGCEKPSERPDIVLVVLDTVRDDYTSAATTPAYHALAGQGTRFSNAWANAPWTVPSHASVFTGTLPSVHGCTGYHIRLDDDRPTLAELLGRSGYRTGAFFSNPWLSDRATGLLRGFEVRHESRFAGIADSATGEPGDQGGRATSTAVRAWLKQAPPDQPLFLFVSYLEAHLPYDPSPDYRRLHLPDALEDTVSVAWAQEFNAGLYPAAEVDWKLMRRLYSGDVHTADRLLSGLLEALDEVGRLNDAVVIVTSDHGENLGDHGLVEHQFSIHETLLDVPLVIHAPGRLAPGVRADPVMLMDLFSTVLDLSGVEAVFPPFSRSLLDGEASGDRPVIAEYAGGPPGLVARLRALNPELGDEFSLAYRTVRVGALRLTAGGDGGVRLHDLSSDPAQRNDLAPDRGDTVAALRETLERWSSLPALRRDGGPELDPETRELLRSLGYVQ